MLFEDARRLADTLAMELTSRSGTITRHTEYYKGKQPLRFASKEFRAYFAEQYKGFSDNWVAPVAEAPMERLTVTGIRLEDQRVADKDLWRVWLRNGLDADSQLGFLGCGLGARCYVLVWGGDDDDVPEVTFEEARQAIVAYEPGSRRKRRAALKMWQDGNREYCTLYLPDEVWKFERPGPGAQPRKSANLQDADEILRDWTERDTGNEPNPQPNPMGVVPMVELPNRPLLADEPISDVSGTISMQDAINLLWSYLFTGAEFAGFPQRIIMGTQPPKIPILDENGKKIGERAIPLEKFAVDRVLWLTDPNAKIANWPEANLKGFTDVIEVAVGHIAAQTRTPQHYLIGRMANLSGDALIAAETGLVKKVEEKQLWFGHALREVFRLICLARGEKARASAVSGGKVVWGDVESRNVSQLADALLKLKQIGFPFEYLAARFGLTPTEITEVVSMRETAMDRALDGDFASLFGGPKPTPPEPDPGAGDDVAIAA
ncbi:phage portal protein [Yinghuangia aomiensis]